MVNMKTIINAIGFIAAGAVVGFLLGGISKIIDEPFMSSPDYLLLAFSAAIISSVCYNIVEKNK